MCRAYEVVVHGPYNSGAKRSLLHEQGFCVVNGGDTICGVGRTLGVQIPSISFTQSRAYYVLWMLEISILQDSSTCVVFHQSWILENDFGRVCTVCVLISSRAMLKTTIFL